MEYNPRFLCGFVSGRRCASTSRQGMVEALGVLDLEIASRGT